MSPENTQKIMGFYMEGFILVFNTMYMLFCFFKLFPIGCIGLLVCVPLQYCKHGTLCTSPIVSVHAGAVAETASKTTQTVNDPGNKCLLVSILHVQGPRWRIMEPLKTFHRHS